MSSEDHADAPARPPSDHRGADAPDLVREALHHLRRIQEAGGSPSGPPPLARQEAGLVEWAAGLGLLLNAEEVAMLAERGGQEHDIYRQGERVFKVTRNGVFGLTPGIELALVSSAEDARRFHLWEASPLDYLGRLQLQNDLVPGLNLLEGVIAQANGDIAIVTSQPRFEIVPVSTAEIDEWFAALGFDKVAPAAYYRAEDNLGIFDAHDKNLVRADNLLIPFDVIPCHPAGGFLDFIAATLAAGHSLQAVRTVTTKGDVE